MDVVTVVKRLLILACSQRKRPDQSLLPAIERYNGPAFQIVRKFLRTHPVEAQSLKIYVLSAKFGLIPASQPTPIYNQRMTLNQAQKLRPNALRKLERLLPNCNKLFINLGQIYWQALAGHEVIIPANISPVIAQGSSGRRQVELRDWLYNGLPDGTS